MGISQRRDPSLSHRVRLTIRSRRTTDINRAIQVRGRSLNRNRRARHSSRGRRSSRNHHNSRNRHNSSVHLNIRDRRSRGLLRRTEVLSRSRDKGWDYPLSLVITTRSMVRGQQSLDAQFFDSLLCLLAEVGFADLDGHLVNLAGELVIAHLVVVADSTYRGSRPRPSFPRQTRSAECARSALWRPFHR